jgi:hypothetical protein
MISRNSIFIILGLLVVAGVFMAGCAQQATPGQTTTQTIPMVNPATNSATTPVEKTSLTVQPSMANPATNSATKPVEQTNLTVQSSMANPASVNCGKIGGSTEIKKNADGSEYGMCTFTNGTSCEEWALYRGEGCKTNVTAPAK